MKNSGWYCTTILLRIEVEQLNSNSELVKARNSFGDLNTILPAVLDIQNPEEIKARPWRRASDSRRPVTPPKACFSDLFKIDNDINLARTDLQILNKTVRSARSANLPTLTIDASYNHGRKVGPIEGAP